jgi:hypothetical protein
MTYKLRTSFSALLLVLSTTAIAQASVQSQFTAISMSMQSHAFHQACTTLHALFDSTNEFADVSAAQLHTLVKSGSAASWIAAAQAAQNAERHAEACAEYFMGVAAYRADKNTNMANIWSSGAVSESHHVSAITTGRTSQTTTTNPTLIGEYSCASYHGNAMLVSSMPMMHVTSGTTYDALGMRGSYTYTPTARTTTSDVIGTLNFTTGGLAGKTGYANQKANGDRAIIFDSGTLDLATTWCYKPK